MERNLQEKTHIERNYSQRLINGKVTATAGVRNPETLEMVYGPGANRIEILRLLEKQSKYNIIWYSCFILLAIVAFIIEPKSWLGCIDIIVLLININLVSKGKVLGSYFGILDCIIYSYISFNNGLFGEVIKNCAIFIPMNIFTIISWTININKQKKLSYSDTNKDEGIIIRKLGKKGIIIVSISILALYAGCYFGLRALGTTSLILSAAVFCLSLMYKILSTFRFKECWFFSIISNTLALAMWISVIITSIQSGATITQFPQVITTLSILTNAFYGYTMWKAMYRKVAVNGGEIFAKRPVKIKKIIKLRHVYKKLVWNKEVDVSRNS